VTAELPRHDPDVVFKRLDDEVVLVHLKTNEIYALNETAARFWELYADGLSRGKIEQRLLAEFDVDPSALAAEIDTLLEDLAREGIVHPR